MRQAVKVAMLLDQLTGYMTYNWDGLYTLQHDEQPLLRLQVFFFFLLALFHLVSLLFQISACMHSAGVIAAIKQQKQICPF